MCKAKQWMDGWIERQGKLGVKMGVTIGGKVEKVDGKKLSYKELVERYLEKNQPVVLTGLMGDWRACRDWVTKDGQPNLLYFSTHFGKSKVQVEECGSREFTDQRRVEMSVSDFIEHWHEMSSKKDTEISKCNRNDQPLLYLKDWHFVKEYPEYVAYTTPSFFQDDWLNLYLDSYHMHTDPDTYQENNEISCSDYRFVYMGAKGTWTPLHADVFRSYSWSANVCGQKKWHFLSPSQCHLVFDSNMTIPTSVVKFHCGGKWRPSPLTHFKSSKMRRLKYKKNSVYDIFDDVSETKFPGFKEAVWLECTQEPNEVIFVPSGWYHQVHNTEDTISINHNWFNAYNISWVCKLLLKDHREAKEYIEDIRDICDDFEGLCQRNLAANTGMNFFDFFVFIARFSFANLVQLYFSVKNYPKPVTGWSPRTQQLFFNLVSIKKVLSNLKPVYAMRESSTDFRDILKELQFLDLCMALGKTYGMLDEHQKQSSDTIEPAQVNLSSLEYIEATCSKVYGPEDLIRVMGYLLTHLGFQSWDENCRLVAKWDDLETLDIL